MAAPARLWKIRRIYLDHIGSPAARFRDVWIEFTNKAGAPLDTILWMRNGGGKSTLIALLCALIRPDRRDFLATATTGRHLEDGVLGADTAHVVVEWVDPSGRRLVTGAVYEWADRIQPADPNAAHDRLRQNWYAFTPDGADVEIEHLPFRAFGGAVAKLPTDLKDFAKAIEALPSDAEPFVTGKQDRWADALTDRGLDPGLFSAILKINATEGGIEHHFKFKTPDDFVQYLLSLVSDPTSAGKVAAILKATRERLARQPRLRAEIAFCDEAVALLGELVQAREHLRTAEATADQERQSAARLAASLVAAAEEARRAADTLVDGMAGDGDAVRAAADRVAELDGEVRELRWWLAHHRHAEAVAQLRRAEVAVAETGHTHRAWQLVPALVQHVEATQRLTAARRQQEEAEAGAEPLRRGRSEAAAVLLAVLERAAAELASTAGTHAAEAAAAEAEERAARAEADELRGRLGGLDSHTRSLEKQLAAFDNDARAAEVDAGELEAEHRTAVERDRQLARQLDHDLPARAAELRADQERYEVERAAVQAALTALSRDKALLDAERDPLLAEIEVLAGDPRLTALTERDLVDPVDEHRLLADMLSEAVIGADRQRIQLAVSDAEDARAVEALASARGLLPAALDLARAADVLVAARIPATTGWHHLADAVPADRWAHAVATAPHLVGGLLVENPADLGRARQALEAAELFPTSAIQVSTTGALTAVSEPSEGFVIQPARAMYDRTAAAEETERRAVGSRRRSERVQELVDARDHDLRLRNQLAALADRCPPGHREHLQAEHERIERTAAEADTRAAELDASRGAFVERAAELESLQHKASAERRVLAGRIGALGDLLKRAPEAVRMREELDLLPQRRERIERDLAAAEAREKTYAATARVQAAEAEQHRAQAGACTSRAAELSRIADGPAREVVPAALPSLAAAQSAYQAAEDAYTKQTSGSALEATITEIANRLSALDDELRRYGTAEREAAVALAGSTAAADPVSSRRAAAEAETQHVQAQRDAALAGAARDAAKRDLDEAARQRPGLELSTKDEQDARDRMATTLKDLEHWQDEQRAAKDRAAAAESTAAAARRRADDLGQHAADLVDEDLDGIESHETVPAFDGDADAAREAAKAARKALQAADKAVSTARGQLTTEGHRIDRWAGEDRFAAVSPEVRDRFRSDHSAVVLAAEAERLAEQLGLYRHTLAGELEAVDKDKHLVVTALCAEVREGLKTLQRAQHHAQLPPGLADHLRNRRFLEVGPRSSVDTSDGTVRSRVERLVEKLVDRKEVIPDGLTLVWEATSAVVGRGNFTARVLKPSIQLGEERQPVELMSKWSGGEKVTISLLLFCMLARLRAANRGGDVPGVGVLPMDNPLGSANYVAFLDLQRQVAAANGIQLVFLSGLGDMRAVGRFPNVVRMRNTHNRGRSYARVVDRELTEDPVVDAAADGITVARLTFPQQETLIEL
jgi:hypothetical protein